MAALAEGLRTLDPDIDPAEAERAARVAYEETYRLAQAYQITDPPLVHNTKVNLGLKPRGLCKDWADDLEARMRQEGFETFSLHRAIANADVPLRIEHSTLILSARGEEMDDGMVLDPWRNGGVLFWSPVTEDADYAWVPRQEVFAWKRQREAARRGTHPEALTP